MTTRAATPLTSFARPPKVKPQNPIDAAVSTWRSGLSLDLTESQHQQVSLIVSGLPKRWVVYHPMVLLPSGSFESGWWNIADPADTVMEEVRDCLWRLLLAAISKREGKGVLTHLAVNSGIPLYKPFGQTEANPEATAENLGDENILRTPSGLVMLYGDFGPSLPSSRKPAYQDFENAFWVSTKQNGIIQIWAPRYTMFSRGNVKEKARLLDFHCQTQGHTARSIGEQLLSSGTAIDLYAGIGYFVFSYAKIGLRTVIGWEINPWSIEGMRRGAIANGWTIRIIHPDEILELGSENIIVLAEHNELALKRLEGLGQSFKGNIRHINCGLLPMSDSSWRMVSKMTTGDAWLHLHENVGVRDVEKRRAEIEKVFQRWLVDQGDNRNLVVEHVELVKTFAPGVWHCVFDVFVSAPDVHKGIVEATKQNQG